jgi:hypothetical protein
MRGTSSRGMSMGYRTMGGSYSCTVGVGSRRVVDGNLRGADDTGLVLILCHIVTFEEVVHAMDLQSEAIELLLQRGAALLRLGVDQLQGNQALLRLHDAVLEPTATALMRSLRWDSIFYN